MLARYVPASPEGVNLEVETREGSAFVSLVGFQFQHCRVMGVPWPGHTDFAEVNLRFYVRTVSLGGAGGAASQRGVVFIREFVPKPIIAYVARKFYNEPYLAAPCAARIAQSTSTISAEYSLTFGAPTPVEYTFRVEARKPVVRPDSKSVEHWFKEHRWGFGMLPPRRGGAPRGVAYEVIHPTWGIYPVERCEVKVDFAAVYGPDWGFLSGTEPANVVLAQGSEVAVFPPRRALAVHWGMKSSS